MPTPSMPPEMRRISPVTQEELGSQSVATPKAMSSGWPHRPSGICLADPLDHLLLGDPQRLAPLCHHLPVEVRVHGTGTDRVDADAVRGELQRQRTREGNHPGLGDVVGGDPRGRILAVDRRQVDDASGLLALHEPRRRATALERAVQVHVQHPLPFLVPELDDGGHVLAQPGAVHEDVQPPARLRDLGEERVHRGGRRHVQAGGCRGKPLAGQGSSDRLGLLALQIRDDHRGASGREGLRDAPPQPLRRAGDHRDVS